MGMTKREFLAKNEIRNILSKEGYPTYSYLIEDFDIHLTKDPDVIGYMVPSKGVITINENLDLNQVSVIVRHEILHEYLNHAKRFERHVGADAYNNRSEAQHQNMNIAGDYEISNRGYTERDKKYVRSIYIDGQKLSGLVTECDHPDWIGLTAEEMYDRLSQEMEKNKEEMQNDLQNKIKVNKAQHSADYIKGYNDTIEALDYDEVTDEELNDILKGLGK